MHEADACRLVAEGGLLLRLAGERTDGSTGISAGVEQAAWHFIPGSARLAHVTASQSWGQTVIDPLVPLADIVVCALSGETNHHTKCRAVPCGHKCCGAM